MTLVCHKGVVSRALMRLWHQTTSHCACSCQPYKHVRPNKFSFSGVFIYSTQIVRLLSDFEFELLLGRKQWHLSAYKLLIFVGVLHIAAKFSGSHMISNVTLYYEYNIALGMMFLFELRDQILSRSVCQNVRHYIYIYIIVSKLNQESPILY